MQFAMAFKIIGVLLILFSTAMLPSLLLSLIAKDGIESAFATGLATTLFAGVMLWLPTRHLSRDCLLYTSPSPRDRSLARMPSSA